MGSSAQTASKCSSLDAGQEIALGAALAAAGSRGGALPGACSNPLRNPSREPSDRYSGSLARVDFEDSEDG
jgi:hypothetical protein